jgi:hypothetical protein
MALKESGKKPTETVINARMTLLANDAAFAFWHVD